MGALVSLLQLVGASMIYGDWRDLRGAIERAAPQWREAGEEARKQLWDFAEAVIAEYAPIHPPCGGCSKKLSWSTAYRCADCHAIYCHSCIRAHFAESKAFAARDRDGAEGGDAKAAPVPQDRQARAEGIAPPSEPSS